MGTEENKVLIRRYLEEIWNKGNLSIADELLAPDYRRYLTAHGVPLDRSAQLPRIAGVRRAFPDWHVEIEDIIAEGDRVSVRLIVGGTQQGEYMGIAPTGKRASAAAFDIFRIENGKIAEHWGGTDTLDILRQIGATIAGPSGT